MIPLAPPPFSCCVHPHRGLSTRNGGSHSMTPFRHPRTISIAYPALHSPTPSALIGLRRTVRSQQSPTQTIGRAPKSP
jgi:hypothetical protein